ncbi:hypothetical protein M0Q39_00800 [Patescibacteria group bacterium]|nr:hypothetical protein [Patescibacteria group bacterium]
MYRKLKFKFFAMDYINEDNILNMEAIDFMIKAREILDKNQNPKYKIEKDEIKLSISNLFLVEDLESRTKIRKEITKDINNLISKVD